MELVDFILQIDCLSHFYDWGKLSVSTATNHTWTTAALAKESPTSQSQQSSAGTVHLSQVPNQLSWLLQKTLHRVPERGRGKKKLKGKKAMDRTGYSGSKQNI